MHQLSMVMDSYRTEYNKQMDDLIKKQNINATVSIEKSNKL
jgi:hypothetical protein